MPAMIFDTCCGCIELRTGCLIIGYLELVGEIILSISMIWFLVACSVAVAQHDNQDVQIAVGAILAIGVITLLVLSLMLAFTITLLVGLHKNKRGHVKAYLIYAAIYFVLSVLGFFGSFAGKIEAGNVVNTLIGLVVEFYCLAVIRSYYCKMTKGPGFVTA